MARRNTKAHSYPVATPVTMTLTVWITKEDIRDMGEDEARLIYANDIERACYQRGIEVQVADDT